MGIVDGGPAEGDGDRGCCYSVTVRVLRAVEMVTVVVGRVVKTGMQVLVSQQRWCEGHWTAELLLLLLLLLVGKETMAALDSMASLGSRDTKGRNVFQQYRLRTPGSQYGRLLFLSLWWQKGFSVFVPSCMCQMVTGYRAMPILGATPILDPPHES